VGSLQVEAGVHADFTKKDLTEFAEGIPVTSANCSAEAQRKGRRPQRKAGREPIHESLLVFLCVLRLFLWDLCAYPV
jgi:hypothetical protein